MYRLGNRTVPAGSPSLPERHRPPSGRRGGSEPGRMSGWDPAATELVRLLARTARGPRREGIFALWLTVRVTQDLLLVPPVADRAQRRRIQALEHRLATLTLPPQLGRALS